MLSESACTFCGDSRSSILWGKATPRTLVPAYWQICNITSASQQNFLRFVTFLLFPNSFQACRVFDFHNNFGSWAEQVRALIFTDGGPVAQRSKVISSRSLAVQLIKEQRQGWNVGLLTPDSKLHTLEHAFV